MLQMKIPRKFQVITLFPEMFTGVFGSSMMWKAQRDGHVELSTINLRDFGLGPRKSVDDTPYGGGDGMLLMIEPLWNAVKSATQPLLTESKKNQNPSAPDIGKSATRWHLVAKPKVLLMTPRGRLWDQSMAQQYASSDDNYVFICGRYEGYDERIVEMVDEEISVGDYVLTGGELPAMTIIDSIVRLIPGVLGGENSAAIESFSDGETLEYPQYTRPEEFQGMTVPKVLLSGNHADINAWRTAHSRHIPDNK